MDSQYPSLMGGYQVDSMRPGSEEDQIRQLERLREQQLSRRRPVPQIQEASQMNPRHVSVDSIHKSEEPVVVSMLEDYARTAAASEEYEGATIHGGIHNTTRHGRQKDQAHITVDLHVHDDELDEQVSQKIHIYLVHRDGRAIPPSNRRSRHYNLRDVRIARRPTFGNAETPRELRVARERAARDVVRQQNAQIDSDVARIDHQIRQLRRAIARRRQEDNIGRRGGNGDDEDDDHRGGGELRIKGRAGLQIKGMAESRGMSIKGMAQRRRGGGGW